MTAWSQLLLYLISLPVTSQDYTERICLLYSLLAWAYSTNGTLNLSFCVTPLLITLPGGIGISTNCPSPTPFGLGLGPDLPWADEPSPGNLRFSAGGILTLLFAYSYRHSLFYPLHQTLQSNFSANRMLPYPLARFDARCTMFVLEVRSAMREVRMHAFLSRTYTLCISLKELLTSIFEHRTSSLAGNLEPRASNLAKAIASVIRLSPVTFSAQNHSTSELLRTL